MQDRLQFCTATGMAKRCNCTTAITSAVPKQPATWWQYSEHQHRWLPRSNRPTPNAGHRSPPFAGRTPLGQENTHIQRTRNGGHFRHVTCQWPLCQRMSLPAYWNTHDYSRYRQWETKLNGHLPLPFCTTGNKSDRRVSTAVCAINTQWKVKNYLGRGGFQDAASPHPTYFHHHIS